MAIKFKIDFDGNYLVRFIPIGEVPKGLEKKVSARGFVEIAGVFDGDKVSPIDYDELLEAINMQGKYSDFKDTLGYWMEDRDLLEEKWTRISIFLTDN